jgi:hypothetical protein
MARPKLPEDQQPRDHSVSVMFTASEWEAVTRISAEETLQSRKRVTISSLIRRWTLAQIQRASKR